MQIQRKRNKFGIQKKANGPKSKATGSETPELASALLAKVESIERRKGTEGRSRCDSVPLGQVGTAGGQFHRWNCRMPVCLKLRLDQTSCVYLLV